MLTTYRNILCRLYKTHLYVVIVLEFVIQFM